MAVALIVQDLSNGNQTVLELEKFNLSDQRSRDELIDNLAECLFDLAMLRGAPLPLDSDFDLAL